MGPWIHFRLNIALWLVDAFCLGLRSVFPCSWSVFSPLFHLHTNIYQHSRKWLVINPYHYVDIYISCIYAGVDGLDLILKSCQQSTIWFVLLCSGRAKGQLGGSCWRSLTIISRRQLDQKIIRVCISYTHLYLNKLLNHTLPVRKCKICFWANM